MLLPRALDHLALGEFGAGRLPRHRGTSGHWLVVLAYRSRRRVRAMAPFRATPSRSGRRCSAHAVFGDVPDGWTFVGAPVIIAGGLYTAHLGTGAAVKPDTRHDGRKSLALKRPAQCETQALPRRSRDRRRIELKLARFSRRMVVPPMDSELRHHYDRMMCSTS